MILNKIYNCDCLLGMQNIPDNSIDCVITDPPYNLGNLIKNRGYHIQAMRNNSLANADWDNSSAEDWLFLMENVIMELYQFQHQQL